MKDKCKEPLKIYKKLEYLDIKIFCIFYYFRT